MSTGEEGGTAGEKITFVFYHYEPSLPAAVIFTVLFAILSALHIWRLIRHRAYYFVPFAVGGTFEVVGYAGRIWSHFKPLEVNPYIVQSLLLLVAPALLAASIYMILGRLISTLRAEHLAVVRSTWITRIFVTGDVISFVMQGGGGGIMAAGGSLHLFEVGEKVIIGGLVVQIVVFGFFIVTATMFHWRCRKEVAIGKTGRVDGGAAVHWSRHLKVLYVVSTLIMVRSIFRVTEYAQGNAGYLISHEVFLYIFDASLMSIVVAVLLVWYVDDIGKIPQTDQFMEQSSREGVELESQ